MGSRPIQFTGNSVEYSQKKWLGKCFVEKRKITSQLAERFNLSKRVLQKYAKSVRDALPLYDQDGRPPKIDCESDGVLSSKVVEINDITYERLLTEIKLQTIETMNRRRPTMCENSIKEDYKISRRSRKRYALKYAEMQPSKEIFGAIRKEESRLQALAAEVDISH